MRATTVTVECDNDTGVFSWELRDEFGQLLDDGTFELDPAADDDEIRYEIWTKLGKNYPGDDRVNIL